MNEIENGGRGQWTSASNAAGDAACAGRHRAQMGIPEPKDTEQAEWAEGGQKIHNALAKQYTAGLNATEVDLYDRCMELENQLVLKWFGETGQETIKVIREKRLWIQFDADQTKHSGQPDVVYRNGPKALILDAKTLTGEVAESPQNMQLRDLAVMVWANHPLLTEVAVAIIQPLVTMKPELCVYKADDIRRAGQEMQARIKASNSPESRRTAGELQCKYCRARGDCKEYATWASGLTPIGSIVDVPVSQWTPEQRASFLNNKGRAQKWLDECEAEMRRLLEADARAVPGWFLKPGKIKENIVNAQSVFDRCSALGMPMETFMATIKVGRGDLKDALAEVTKLKGKKLAEKMDEVTAGATETKQDRPSLAKKDE